MIEQQPKSHQLCHRLPSRRRSARWRFVAALGLAGALAASPAHATRGGTIFSGPTRPDPMVVYHNPAGMMLLRGNQLLAFSALTISNATYQRATPRPLTNRPFPEVPMSTVGPTPSLGAVTDATLSRWRFGVALSAPFNAGADWADVVDNQPSASRYHLISGISSRFLISLAAAHRINRYVSVGASVDIYGVWLQQSSMLDLGARINQEACAAAAIGCQVNAPIAREDPEFAARTEVAGVGWNIGVGAGLLVTPNDWLILGVAIHSGNSVNVPMSFRVDLPPRALAYLENNLPTLAPPPLEGDVTASAAFPTVVTAGVTVALLQHRLELSADLHWGRTSADTLTVADVTRSSSGLVPQTWELVRAARDEYVISAYGTYRLLSELRLALRVEVMPVAVRPDEFVSPSSLGFAYGAVFIGADYQVTPWLKLIGEIGQIFTAVRDIHVSAFRPIAQPTTLVEQGLDRPSATGRYAGTTTRLALGAQLSF